MEIAKSSRADCKRCEKKIAKDTLRVGIILEGDWGLFTRWQHLECTIFNKALPAVTDIEGYREIDEKSKILLTKRHNIELMSIWKTPYNDHPFLVTDSRTASERSTRSSSLSIPMSSFVCPGISLALLQQIC